MFQPRQYAYGGPGEQHVGIEDFVLELLWAALPMEDVVLPAGPRRRLPMSKTIVQLWSL
jgi:hypothetical protein